MPLEAPPRRTGKLLARRKRATRTRGVRRTADRDYQRAPLFNKSLLNPAFVALDTRPNYIDTTPMPATSAKWKHRAIYSNDAQRVVQWSNVAEIAMGV